MDDVSDIRSLYDESSMKEDARLDRHQLEFDLTWRYLLDYLPSHRSLLELGAASGRYTLPLAQQGYRITAVDLSDALTQRSRQRVREAGLDNRVRYLVGDARDLSMLQGEEYAAVLVMGPLYHLVYEADRLLVLRQVYRLLAPGGLVFSAFISRFGMLGDLLANHPEWVQDKAELETILEWGRDPKHLPRGGFRGYFARVEEIAPLHESAGFETLRLAGVEPAISADDDAYNRLDGELRQAWQDVLYRVSAEPSTVGASRHLLYIGRRPNSLSSNPS